MWSFCQEILACEGSLRHILDYIARINIRVQHVFKEENSVADLLASPERELVYGFHGSLIQNLVNLECYGNGYYHFDSFTGTVYPLLNFLTRSESFSLRL